MALYLLVIDKINHSKKYIMDSINKNQEEENHKDLGGPEAIKKIKELAENETCFFATGITAGKPLSVRPMSAQKIDENGSLYFLSANDSQKNQQRAQLNKDSAIGLTKLISEKIPAEGVAKLIQERF